MKRKNQLYEEMKIIEKELKALSSLLHDEGSVPTEDEIHGWAIQMDICTNNLKSLKEDTLEFFRN